MLETLANIFLGLIPTLILGASIAAGTKDDRAHRRVFVLVYGLWALTLAMWNWMRGMPVGWTILWSVAGVAALIWYVTRR